MCIFWVKWRVSECQNAPFDKYTHYKPIKLAHPPKSSRNLKQKPQMFSHLEKKHHRTSLNITQFEKNNMNMNKLSSSPTPTPFWRGRVQLTYGTLLFLYPKNILRFPKAPRTCPWTLPWSVPPSNCRPSPSNPRSVGIPKILRILLLFCCCRG